VLPVLWGADLANPTAILATIHQTVARLGDLCKALERLEVQLNQIYLPSWLWVWGESLVGTTCVVPGPSLFHHCV
jgi:hypothetical protein